MKKIWIFCLLPFLGLLLLTGCSTNRELNTVKTMFEEMVQTYKTPSGNTMFTTWGVDPHLDEGVFEKGENGKPNDLVQKMNANLQIAYSQVQYLYGNILSVATDYLDKYSLYIYENEEKVKSEYDKVNTVYNEVIALRKVVYSFSRTKDGLFEELKMIQPESAIFYEKLKNFCFEYAHLVDATLNYANAMKELNQIIRTQDVTLLTSSEIEESVKRDIVARVFDDARLTYATIVFKDNIDVFQNNNLSGTFGLQYFKDGQINNYSLSRIDQLTTLAELNNQDIEYDAQFEEIGKKAKNMQLLQDRMHIYLAFYDEARSKVNLREYYQAKLKEEYNTIFSTGINENYAKEYYSKLSNEQKGCIDFILDFSNLDVRYFYQALLDMTN